MQFSLFLISVEIILNLVQSVLNIWYYFHVPRSLSDSNLKFIKADSEFSNYVFKLLVH